MFRIYAIPGCPWCQKATDWLEAKKVPYERIEVGQDPVIGTGLAVIFPGRPPQFPLLWAEHTRELVVGYKEADLERLVTAFYSNPGTGISNGSSDAQLPAGAAPDVVEQSAPEDSGVA